MNQRDRTCGEELNQVTEQIIGNAFTVSNELGSGFLEKVYENALAHELRKSGIQVKQQYPIQVYYDGIVVGNYVADLLINDCVLVELKAIRALGNVEMAQCLNYLKATDLRLCLLLNFGQPRVEVKRIVNDF
ncbi:MAG: GxxExxY protein [Chloroflexi bacterium]|nr:GxxExxY protein [Chloroflexota bacterium]